VDVDVLSRNEAMIGFELAAVIAKQSQSDGDFGTVKQADPDLGAHFAWLIQHQIHIPHSLPPIFQQQLLAKIALPTGVKRGFTKPPAVAVKAREA
jgi:hypothetical protein